jgi:hypothetical protein
MESHFDSKGFAHPAATSKHARSSPEHPGSFFDRGDCARGIDHPASSMIGGGALFAASN